MDIIQKKDELTKSKTEDTEESIQEEIESLKVDTYQIQAITTMLDDFENIISKNFCQFADYEDFSFAQSRNTDSLNNHFNSFYAGHF